MYISTGYFNRYVFKTFDADNSGEIDFVEFLIFISSTSQGDVREQLRITFNIYDIDKNGEVDRKEMLKIIESIYALRGETYQNSLDEIVDKIIDKFGLFITK